MRIYRTVGYIFLILGSLVYFIPPYASVVFFVLGIVFLLLAKPEVMLRIKRKTFRKVQAIPSTTLQNEKVKSRSEAKIANYLSQNNIDYRYEKQIHMKVKWAHKRYRNKFKPDFYLPKYDVYIEYFGLWEQPKYQKKARQKMAIYHSNRIKLIPIFPNTLKNIDWSIKKDIRKLTGKEVK